MSRSTIASTTFVSTLAVLFTTVIAASANATQASVNIENIVSDWQARHGVLGLTASCATEKGVVSSAAGFAEAAKQSKLTTDHQFQIGSVAKTYTAAVILGLVEEGQISLSDPLSNWYPGYPNAEAITVRQLLDMTAGTFDYFRASADNPVIPVVMQDINRIWAADEVIEIVSNLPPQAGAGDGYWYSNTNYLFLGRIAEMVTDSSLGTIFQHQLFEPFGFSDTVLAGTRGSAKPTARGYLRDSAFLFGHESSYSAEPDDHDGLGSLAWAAGGMTATSVDIARWGQALFSGRVIPEILVDDMVRASARSIAEGTPYGLGVEVFETKLGRALGHPGSIPGYAAMLMYFPTFGRTVAVLTNDESGEPHLKELAVKIAEYGCAR